MTENGLTLTLDIGTSSTRVLLWDTEGRELEGIHAQVKYQMHTTPDGGVEMDARELLGHVNDCLSRGLAQAGDRAASIRAVGISSFWHSLLGLDAHGQPLTPLYNWSDTRAAEAALRLRAELDEQAIHMRTGCMLHPSYYPAKLVWLRERDGNRFDQTARWASPAEYLCGCWFGDRGRHVSISIASGTGLMNQARSEWDAETLQALQLSSEKLAPIENLTAPMQGLEPEYARGWPALQNVPFFPAVGDGVCGSVGSGCVSPRRFAINLGTSGAIRTLWNENPTSEDYYLPKDASLPTGLWRYRADAHRPVVGAAFSDGGIVYQWMSSTLNLPPASELDAQLSAVPIGNNGMTFLPFLSGERSLGWNPMARAALAGMNLDTGPVEILHAAMEAIALRFALAAKDLRAMFPQVVEIIASGGALSHSPLWTQMFADAIGQPITLTAEPEASSRGAALLAMEAVGLIKDTAEPPARMGQIFTPNADHQKAYEDLLAIQQNLYSKLITPLP